MVLLSKRCGGDTFPGRTVQLHAGMQAEGTSINAAVVEDHQKVSAAMESTSVELQEAATSVKRRAATEVLHVNECCYWCTHHMCMRKSDPRLIVTDETVYAEEVLQCMPARLEKERSQLEEERYTRFAAALQAVNSHLSRIICRLSGLQGDASCSYPDSSVLLAVQGVAFHVRHVPPRPSDCDCLGQMSAPRSPGGHGNARSTWVLLHACFKHVGSQA